MIGPLDSRIDFGVGGAGPHSGGVSDLLLPTRFGPLDEILALASRHAVAVTAIPALLVLDDVHLRLGIAYTSTGAVPPAERPTDRWTLLMRQLFQFDHHGWHPGTDCASADVRPVWNAAPPGIQHRLRKATTDQRKVVVRLLVAAASWLLVESGDMEERVQLAGSVYYTKPRPFELVPTPTLERLWRVPGANTLLNHAEPDKIDCLLQARYDHVRGYCSTRNPGKHERPHTYPSQL